MNSRRTVVVDVLLLATSQAPRREQRVVAERAVLGRAGPLTRICPRCGSTDHGQPRVQDGYVSLSYSPGLVAVALADSPVGVDVEWVGTAPAGFVDTGAWTQAEAILKATGEGVRRDPATAGLVDAWTAPLDLAEPYVGWIALLGVGGSNVTLSLMGSQAAGAHTATDAVAR